MRDPRPGVAWSKGRLRRRAAYASWMASREWLERRQAWEQRFVADHGSSPLCAACGEPWNLRHGDLHHRSYARLGYEADRDLIPLCAQPCHDRVHRILESTPAWRRLERTQASDMIVARLRAQSRERRDRHGRR